MCRGEQALPLFRGRVRMRRRGNLEGKLSYERFYTGGLNHRRVRAPSNRFLANIHHVPTMHLTTWDCKRRKARMLEMTLHGQHGQRHIYTHVSIIFYYAVEHDGLNEVEWQLIMTTMTDL